MGTTNQAAQLPWVLLASSAFKNINQQLVNQYSELKDAIESLALDAFSIDDFYPEKAQDFSLLNSLTGLSGIFTIVGGFVPTVGPAIEAAGTIASAVGTFLTNSASSNDPLEAQKVFSQKVLTYYRGLLSAMEDIVLKLFAGDSIPGPGPGSFNITDMMKNGSWVNPNVVTRVSDLNRKIRTEILARSIDSLWKTPTQNKMWVLFKDLEDDASQSKCENDVVCVDKTGPQDSIYCADGGVYYTYNFIEVKGEGGGVGWPWGADKLEKTVNITMKAVTEASAKSYRLMKDTGGDPFNFTQTNGTAAFLFSAFTPRSSPSDYNNTDLSESVGRFPGSWTLPVCDISTWNYEWNWDYTQANFDSKGAYWTHPPCLCGPQALETFDWAKAAGMQEFQTFWDRCEQVLHHENFVWPDGVTFVNYPDKDGKQITIRKR
ncbi:MAG: hypothetical protein M1836_002768 [Candelina mexicana]|nr:MAG: hypothetical protein M1836_002768 [Candelina mexicana]